MKKLFLLFSLAVGFIACEADEIFDLNQEVVALSDQLDQETKDRIAADAENFETLQTLINEVVENQAIINEAFEAADAALAEAIAAEEAAREAGDLTQAEALAVEVQERKDDVAELTAKIAEESAKLFDLITTNANAIIALDKSLTEEIEARMEQDSILLSRIRTNFSFILSNARAISQEVADRKAAIAELDAKLDDVKAELEQAIIDGDQAVIDKLNEQVSLLQSQITDNVNAIAWENERLDKVEEEMAWAARFLDELDGNVDYYADVDLSNYDYGGDDSWNHPHLKLSDAIEEVVQAIKDAQNLIAQANENISDNDTDILNLQNDVEALSGQVSESIADLQNQIDAIDFIDSDELAAELANYVDQISYNNDSAVVSETLSGLQNSIDGLTESLDALSNVQNDLANNAQLIGQVSSSLADLKAVVAAIDFVDDTELQNAISDLETKLSTILINTYWNSVIASVGQGHRSDTDECYFRYITFYGQNAPDGIEVVVTKFKAYADGTSLTADIPSDANFIDDNGGINVGYSEAINSPCNFNGFLNVGVRDTIDFTFEITLGGVTVEKTITGIDLTTTSTDSIIGGKIIVKRPPQS